MGVDCSPGVKPTLASMAATSARVGAVASCTLGSECTKSTADTCGSSGVEGMQRVNMSGVCVWYRWVWGWR